MAALTKRVVRGCTEFSDQFASSEVLVSCCKDREWKRSFGEGSYNGKMNLIHEPSGPLSLQLASPFPNQQFVDQTFSVRMHLVDGHGQIVRRHRIPVKIDLAMDDIDASSEIEASGSLFTYLPSQVFIDNDGVVEFTMKFLPAAIQGGQRAYSVRVLVSPTALDELRGFTPSDDPPRQNSLAIFTSKPIHLISQCLSVNINIGGQDYSRDSNTAMWYKDEGGRDHTIELNVQLVNHQREIIKGYDLPLMVQLLYENGDPVMKPHMLTIVDSHTRPSPSNANIFSDLKINSADGSTRLRVRINDISKNHQRQLFKIRASVDIARSGQYALVGYGETTAVEVKSKRTKRSRDSATTSQAVINAPLSSDPFIHSSMLFDAVGSNHSMSGSEIPPSKRSFPHANGTFASPSLLAPPPPSSFASSSGHDSNEHVRSIMEWSDLVLRKLQALRWTTIGYQASMPTSDNNGYSNNDAIVDKSKPLFSMVNPNETIDSLISYYRDHVSSHLQALTATTNNDPISAEKHSFYAQNGDHSSTLAVSDKHGIKTGIPSSEETSVYYILAIPYHELFDLPSTTNPYPSDHQLYFPAFHENLSLLGFYVEIKDASHATIIRFLPINDFLISNLSISPENCHTLLSAVLSFGNNTANPDSKIKEVLEVLNVSRAFSMETIWQSLYSLRKHRDLESMKQDALVHYWLEQVAFNDL